MKPLNFKSFLYLPINHICEFSVSLGNSEKCLDIYKYEINAMRHHDFFSKNIISTLLMRRVE